MRVKFIALAVLCLFLINADYTAAQKGQFKVVENESRYEIKGSVGTLKLAVESNLKAENVSIDLVLLSPADKVVTQASRTLTLRKGLHKYDVSVSVDALKLNDLMWYRLKYRISNSDNPEIEETGIISLSNLLEGYFDIYVTGGGLLFSNRPNTVTVSAIDSTNGKPVKGVEIEARIDDDENEPAVVKAVTDKHGFASFDFSIGEHVYNVDIEIKGRKGGIERTLDFTFDAKTSSDVIIQTDKPIYEPGQEVRIRIQALDFHRRPLVSKNLNVILENSDSDYDELFTQAVTTSKYGIASTSWTIPEGTKLGNYRISVEDSDGDSRFGSESIRITRYDIPTFYVDASSAKPFYLLSDRTAELEVDARYLFGKPVVDAEARVVFERSEYGRSHEFDPANGRTGTDGSFSAKFALPPSIADELEEEKFVDLTFRAYVTDPTSNRTEEKRVDIRVSKEPIHVYLLGRTHELSNRLSHRFYVSTFYPDGTPAECIITVIEKRESDNGYLPGRILKSTGTNEFGIGAISLDAPLDNDGNLEEEIELKIGAVDQKGSEGATVQVLEFEDTPGLSVKTESSALRPGDPIEAVVTSSDEAETVFVDVVKNREVLVSKRTKLRKGTNRISIPYQKEFRNELAVVVYFKHGPRDSDSLIYATRGLIYPTPDYLKIKARNVDAVYRPGENVSIDLFSQIGNRSGVDTAFGVLVLDRAIEERARSIGERAGNEAINRTFVSRLMYFYGEKSLFGRITFNQIKNLDLSRPLSRDFELMLEAGLRDEGFKPIIETSDGGYGALRELYRDAAALRLKPLADAIETAMDNDADYPKDGATLANLLDRLELNPAEFKDPWNNLYMTRFSQSRDRQYIQFVSPGPDKTANTADDFEVRTIQFRYFAPVGRRIDKKVSDYAINLGTLLTDYASLSREIRKDGFDLDKARDPFGNQYRYEFAVEGSMFILRVYSNGPDGKASNDDTLLWTTYSDYFAVTRVRLKADFEAYVQETKAFPRNVEEMTAVLKKLGFDIANSETPLGPARFFVSEKSFGQQNDYQYSDETGYYLVKKKVIRFSIVDIGADNKPGTFDDHILVNFDGAIDETRKEIGDEDDGLGGIISKRTTSPAGAIGGTVFDVTGAVVPGAEVLVRGLGIVRKGTTNLVGRFVFDNLPEGIYSLEAEAIGFNRAFVSSLLVTRGSLLLIPVYLDVGMLTMMVDVTSDAESMVNTSDSALSSNVTRSSLVSVRGNPDGYTPRIRSDFAETLFWQPELVSDKKGRAKIDFKAADSLTTWKVYVVGSTAEGQFGMVEQEFQTFQPFFAELDPPKILTVGDEISLPVPIRNYTKKTQDVAVELQTDESVTVVSQFSSLLNPPHLKNVSIEPDSTKNAIFDLRAVKSSAESKLTAKAISRGEGDAVEKPLKIVPDGKQVIETQTRMFEGATTFEFEIPDVAIPENRKLSVKIFPGMIAHVHDAIGGLLERPYGCGEQTTSSTYPNLMILKFENENPGAVDAVTRARALEFLQDGYKRLLRYQTDGGFGYWNGNDPDIALTAYVLRFLHDAEEFIEVDEGVVEKAENWLLGMQSAKGSWQNSPGVTAYVSYALANTASNDIRTKKAVSGGLDFIKTNSGTSAKLNIAAFAAIAAYEIGDADTAGYFARMLSFDWSNHGQTPFNGWGRSAEIETAAITLSALIKEKKATSEIAAKALLFIMQNKDKYGVWYSTKTTVAVLNALVEYQDATESTTADGTSIANIRLNGKPIGMLKVDRESIKPVIVEATEGFLRENRLEISGLEGFTMAQGISSFYTPWESFSTDGRFFEFDVGFSKHEAAVSDEITCNVRIKKRYHSAGMLLAEIGTPPGADVDSASLQELKNSSKISSYDILPNKVVIYMPGSRSDFDFSFKFKLRYGINAQTPESTVYDYYNEDAHSIVAPKRFVVK